MLSHGNLPLQRVARSTHHLKYASGCVWHSTRFRHSEADETMINIDITYNSWRKKKAYLILSRERG